MQTEFPRSGTQTFLRPKLAKTFQLINFHFFVIVNGNSCSMQNNHLEEKIPSCKTGIKSFKKYIEHSNI